MKVLDLSEKYILYNISLCFRRSLFRKKQGAVRVETLNWGGFA